jgi:hypothetical protein
MLLRSAILAFTFSTAAFFTGPYPRISIGNDAILADASAALQSRSGNLRHQCLIPIDEATFHAALFRVTEHIESSTSQEFKAG